MKKASKSGWALLGCTILAAGCGETMEADRCVGDDCAGVVNARELRAPEESQASAALLGVSQWVMTDSRPFIDAATRPAGDLVVLAETADAVADAVYEQWVLNVSRGGALGWAKSFREHYLSLGALSASPYDGRSAVWGTGAYGTPILKVLSEDGTTVLGGASGSQYYSIEGGGFGPDGEFVYRKQGGSQQYTSDLQFLPSGGWVPFDASFRFQDAIFAPDGDVIAVGTSATPVAGAQVPSGSAEDFYWVVMKVGVDGTVRWAENFAGARFVTGEILLSRAGEVYVSGTLKSGALAFPGGTISADTQGGSLHVVVALDAHGQRRWGHVLRWTAGEWESFRKGFSSLRLAADGSLVAYFGGCGQQLQLIRISEHGQKEVQQRMDVGAQTCVRDVETHPDGTVLVGTFDEGEVSLAGQVFPVASGLERGGFAAMFSRSQKPGVTQPMP